MEKKRLRLALPLRLLQQAPALPCRLHLQPQSESGRCRLPAQSPQVAAAAPAALPQQLTQPVAPRAQGDVSARQRRELRADQGRAHRLPLLRPKKLRPQALLLPQALQLPPLHRDCHSMPAQMPSLDEALQWAVQAVQWVVPAQLRPLLRLQLLRLAHRAAATSQRPLTAASTSTSQARWATAFQTSPILARLLGLTAWVATSVLRISLPAQGLPLRAVLRGAALVQAQALDSEGGQHSILSRSIRWAALKVLQALLQLQLEAWAACQLCCEMASF